jgi:hypothetical protein
MRQRNAPRRDAKQCDAHAIRAGFRRLLDDLVCHAIDNSGHICGV